MSQSNQEVLPPFPDDRRFLRRGFESPRGPARMCPQRPRRRAAARHGCYTGPWVSSEPGWHLLKDADRCSGCPSPPGKDPPAEGWLEIRTRSLEGAANVVLCVDG